jgi:hypothetical protein
MNYQKVYEINRLRNYTERQLCLPVVKKIADNLYEAFGWLQSTAPLNHKITFLLYTHKLLKSNRTTSVGMQVKKHNN